MKSVKRKGLRSLFDQTFFKSLNMKEVKDKEEKAPISMYRHGYVLPLLFVLLFILAFASSIVVSAHECDCGTVTKFTGTTHGGIYISYYEGIFTSHVESTTFTDVPAGIKIARVYTGIWGGSPSGGGEFNIKVRDHLSPTYEACDPCPQSTECYPWQEQRCNATDVPDEVHDYITGCQVHFISYNATPYVQPGDNFVEVSTHGITTCPSGSSPFDGRIYNIALFVLYENETMPEITYWVNEGTSYMDNGSSCCNSNGHYNEIFIYFNETAYPGSLIDMQYWTYAAPNSPDVNPELNGNDIGDCDTGSGRFLGWLSIPPSYLKTSNNLFHYVNYNNPEFERINNAVLMLNYSDPANLTVTDVSPESLIADWGNGITAKIVNYGDTAHFFNVTLYANDEVVAVKRVENLGEGENRTVKFFWKPSATGSYVLNVTADVENVVRETDETNNSKTVDVEVKEAQPPAWSNQSSNVTEIPNGGTIELSAQGIADVGLERAILCTDENEAGTLENVTDGRYGSPMNMASHNNHSVTHTSESDWNNQTNENLSIVNGDMKLGKYGAGSENLARLKTCYASSESEYDEPKENANDGIHGTGWCSADNDMPCWWYVDLGDVKDVNKINLYGYDYSTPLHYKILISDDGTTWTEKIDKSYSTAGQYNPDTYTLLGWSCRYINVTVISNDYSSCSPDCVYGGFGELEAYPPLGYNSDGTLTSKTTETDNPIVSVTPEWNSTEPTGTNLSVNVSVDNGATWKNATNGTELTWDYNISNRKLKYKVLFETTDVNETPVLHDITLNYTTKDPIESEWLWSNFTWHNASIPDGTTVGWKIYYEDMLGQTNCTAVKTFYVGETGDAPNVVVTVHNTSFGNILAGDNITIYISLTLNNSEGTGPATIEAVFKTNVSVVYGLNGTFGSNIIPGNYFELGPDGSETALTNTTTKTFISTLLAGENVTYNAILTVPAGQAADDYSGIVELSW